MNLRQCAGAAVALTFATAAPEAALACACGCGVFDIGEAAMMPNNANSGFSAWARFGWMDQNRNWEGGGPAPAGDNHDKDLETALYTFGVQYVIDRRWTVSAELPVYDRSLRTTDDGTVFGPAGSLYTGRITSPGDLQLMATFTGFSPDMSTGLSVGMKLPTGDWRGPKGPLGGSEFDRDSLPGTGTTDLMVGGYHVGSLNAKNTLSWFVQARYQIPLAAREGYRPGNELDAASGLAWDLGGAGPVKSFAPVLQLLGSWRARDSGANADPLNSGYQRLYLDPGVAVRFSKVRLSADIAVPLWQHFSSAPGPALVGTAGQLAAPYLLRLQAAYDF
ncbi:MAG TPA: hypothetical protein VGS12_18715 [Caulobacteraceae bacterium]|nr:hypothetical protein [Caulobacteraceae bacterium]